MTGARAVFCDPGGDLPVDPAGGWFCRHANGHGDRYLESKRPAFVRCPDCGALWLLYGSDGRSWAKVVSEGVLG